MEKPLKLPREYTDLGTYLATCRNAVGLTQKKIADKLGYSSAQFISNFERGIAAPPIKKLKPLIKMVKAEPAKVRDLIIAAESKILSKELNIR